ncbi:MAG: basic amino acid ABC transporter substrate-binding protein [bacterium]
MIRAMRFLPLALLTVLLLAACAGEQESQTRTSASVVQVGTDATYPPFESINPATNQPAGFDVDLIKEISRLNDWQIEFVITPFDKIVDGLKAGDFDIIISAMTITQKRAALVDFSDAYFTAGQSIAVPLEDSSISGAQDLTGKKVGVQLGTTGEMMAQDMEGLHVYSYDNIGQAFDDLAAGNLDVVLNDFPTTKALVQQLGTAKIVGEIMSEEQYGLAVRKGDTEKLQKINQALKEIKDSGRFDSIYTRWFGSPPSRPVTADSVGSP